MSMFIVLCCRVCRHVFTTYGILLELRRCELPVFFFPVSLPGMRLVCYKWPVMIEIHGTNGRMKIKDVQFVRLIRFKPGWPPVLDNVRKQPRGSCATSQCNDKAQHHLSPRSVLPIDIFSFEFSSLFPWALLLLYLSCRTHRILFVSQTVLCRIPRRRNSARNRPPLTPHRSQSQSDSDSSPQNSTAPDSRCWTFGTGATTGCWNLSHPRRCCCYTLSHWPQLLPD
jgi:hypothetical protein